MFVLITFFWVSVIEYISITKLKNNIEWASFGATSARNDPKNNLRVNPIIESEIFSVVNLPVLLWISLSGTVTNQSEHDYESLRWGVDRKTIVDLSSKSACFLIIPINLISNVMVQTLGSGHNYLT